MEFPFVIRATQKSGKPDAFVWIDAKTESRAALMLDVALEDAGIETGRGKDYMKPVRTDFPVFNDLPEESTVDLTWCERYELAEDMRTWQLKPGSKPDDAFHNESKPAATADATAPTDANAVTTTQETEKEAVDLFAYGKFPYEKKVLGTWLYGLFDTLTTEQLQEIALVELDMGETYAQNVLLAARDFKTRPIEHVFPETLADLFIATKSIWPVNGKAPMLNDLITFFAEWINTHQSDRVSRDDVTAKWFAKHRKAPAVETKSAPEPVQTKERYKRAVPQSTAGLRNEIAIAQLYPDAEPGKISRPQLTGAKDLQEREEAVFITATKTLMGITDILDYDTQTVFGVTRALKWNGENSVKELRQQARSWLAENGIYETGEPSNGYDEWSTESREQSENKDSAPGTQPENQLEVKNHGSGIFSVEDLMANSKLYGNKSETTSNGQMETTEQPQAENSAALSAGEGTVEDDSQADTVTETVCTGCGAIGGGHCPDCGSVTGDATYAAMESGLKEELDTLEHDSNKQETPTAEAPITAEETAPELEKASEPEDLQAEPAIEYPAFFEPGRYEGLPNEVYHAANGISSTQVKDARVSLMYYHGRHVTGVIPRQDSPAFLFGRVTHSLVLEPEKFPDEYAIPAEMPESVVSTTADLVALIKEYNASLPALMTLEELKAWIEAYNNDLIPPLSLSGDAEEIGMLYISLPDKFRRLPEDEKHTVAKMKACIKEYNESLPSLLKVSGTRDQLLDQIATVAPEMAKSERAKFIPYNTSGTKETLTEIVRSIRPDVVTAEDWYKQQEQSAAGKTTISLAMYEQAKNINDALQADKDASWLLNHPARKSEVSYFGFDEETGIELRARPDIEIRPLPPQDSICADLKTVSLGYVPQDRIKARLHREIIERGYHISAAMYCDTAELDTFAWIFVNKDPGYHWVAVVWAPVEMLELGRLEYRRLLRQINEATYTDNWPAPITGKYVDELNDYDINRLSELSEMKLEDLA